MALVTSLKKTHPVGNFPHALAKLATVSTSSAIRIPTAAQRPNMVSIGTIVWLASELMFFAGLFAMYFTLRSVNPELWVEEVEKLNIPL